jgi:putative solute:sodium symporter small subunit
VPHHGAEAPTSDIAGVYVRSLIRSQLRLGIVFAVGFAVATAVFVLAIAFVPQLDETFVLGVPLSWLLLGAGVYPLAITVGALYVRAASRNEARYRSLTEDE